MAIPTKLLETELKEFETRFRESVKSNTPLLDRIMAYIVKRKGKQLRPMFVLLSARAFGVITEPAYRAASLVELLHTATLVHDDVVDDSLERRGFFSVYALWKNKASVLVGDYLLAKGLLLSLDHNDYEILHILSTAVRKMSEGELLQIEKSRALNINEDVYFEIIRNKTASLLASACAAGAWSTTHNKEITEQMRLFGEKTGIAFQIKDDLFDYSSKDIGKPTGNDIKEKKLTLPLIYALAHADSSLRKQMMYVIKNENKNKARVQWLIEQVVQQGGITYATQVMEQYKQDALAILSQLPENEAVTGLEELVRYVTERDY